MVIRALVCACTFDDKDSRLLPICLFISYLYESPDIHCVNFSAERFDSEANLCTNVQFYRGQLMCLYI